MRIENKVIPEGINTTDENPLKEFSLLVFGIIGALIALIVAISLAAELLAPFVPFRWEQKVADKYQQIFLKQDAAIKPGYPRKHLTAYLQQLADSIAKTQALPDDMNITVHYIDTDVVNAFATLGGHIVLFRGLLEKMPDENALAWVMAHEIAHIKNRDPIKSLGRGVIVGTVISMTGIAAGDDIVGNVMGQSGLLTILKFSRGQEEEADVEALQSLHDLYGHAGSASAFLTQIKELQEQTDNKTLEFLETHPLTENRLKNIEEITREQGWETKGKAKPLPKEFAEWIKGNKMDVAL